jgi:hypothetical protein
VQATTLSLVMGTFSTLFDFNYAFIAPPLCQLGQSLALGHVGEFACATRALAPFALILAFSKTINMLLALHLLDIDSPRSDSLLDFEFDLDLELSMDLIKVIFLRMSHLSASCIFDMVFEHLQDFFNLEI